MAPCKTPEAEEEEEEMDPDYGFFLNHLHPRGTSYVFQHDDYPPPHRPIRINYEEPVDKGLLPSIDRYTKKKEEEAEEEDYVQSEVLDAAADTSSSSSSSSSSSIDKHFGDFLHRLRRMRDGSIVLELDNGVVVPYEKEEEEEENEGPTQESRCSSNNKSPHRPPSRHRSPGCPAEDPPFKEKLMKALERPFDQREFDKLMKLANACKPVVKFKHLRTDDIPYESETMGLSYFDYYPELARKVKHADHFTGLNLLRGFFFWLKNLELEGSYKPWV